MRIAGCCLALLLSLLLCGSCRAQGTEPGANPFQARDVSLSVMGDFAETRDPVVASSGVTLGTNSHALSETPGAGVLAGTHQQWTRFLGYRADLSYTSTKFNYFYEYVGIPNVSSNTSNGSIPSQIFEASASYELQGPRNRRLSTFFSVGGSLLAFNPTDDTQPTSHVFRSAGVGALGVDFHLSPKFDLRSQYRGLYFQSPNFRYMNGPINVVERREYTSQIAVGLAYRFGRH